MYPSWVLFIQNEVFSVLLKVDEVNINSLYVLGPLAIFKRRI